MQRNGAWSLVESAGRVRLTACGLRVFMSQGSFGLRYGHELPTDLNSISRPNLCTGELPSQGQVCNPAECELN